MFDLLFTDIIDIVKITTDEWGKVTKTLIEDVSCRVEDENKVVRNQSGAEVTSNSFIMLNSDVDITYEDKIKIQKINDVDYPLKDKELAILKLEKAHSIDNSFYQVYV